MKAPKRMTIILAVCIVAVVILRRRVNIDNR